MLAGSVWSLLVVPGGLGTVISRIPPREVKWTRWVCRAGIQKAREFLGSPRELSPLGATSRGQQALCNTLCNRSTLTLPPT